MKEMTIKEIQDVSLNILKDVHAFCVSHNIKYSLAFGTLLGAIRHKGFIPWDDDVDIMMLRPDYEKFIKEYESENYKLISNRSHRKCMIAYARVCDMSKTVVRKTDWINQRTGIWIDIFPIDAAEDDVEEYKKRQNIISGYLHDFAPYRLANKLLSRDFGFLVNAKTLVLRILLLTKTNGAKMLEDREKIMREIPIGKTKHVCSLSCVDGLNYFHFDDFKDTIDLPFEDCLFKGIIGYDSYLKDCYGNYMELPPVEKRQPQQSYLIFEWK